MQALKRALLALFGPKRLLALRRRYLILRVASNTVANEPESSVVPALLTPGRQALDLGANVGLYTTLLARHLGTRGQVHAIEPLQENKAILDGVLGVRRMRHVRTYLEAIGSRSGPGEILIPEMEDYNGLYWAKLEADPTHSQGERRKVRVRSLDDLVRDEGIMDLDFIKCDVEGGEIDVIRGGRETLSKFKPSLLIEVAQETSALVFETLREHGYRAFVLRGHSLDSTEHFLPGQYCNYFFLHPGSAGWKRAQKAALIP